MVIMLSAAPKRKRLRFSEDDDMALLRQVVAHRPFSDPQGWVAVKQSVFSATGKDFYLRTLKEHLDLLITLWLQKIPDVKSKLEAKEYTEKDLLCEEVHGSMIQFRNKKKVSNNTTSRASTKYEGSNKSITNNTDNDSSNDMNPLDDTNNEYTNYEYILQPDEVMLTDEECQDTDADRNSQQGEDSSSNVQEERKSLSPAQARMRNISHQYNARKLEIKKREQALDEKRLALEERKLALQEKKLALEEHERKTHLKLLEDRLNTEIELRREMSKMLERQDNIIDMLMAQCKKQK